jgi:hypothetical protein
MSSVLICSAIWSILDLLKNSINYLGLWVVFALFSVDGWGTNFALIHFLSHGFSFLGFIDYAATIDLLMCKENIHFQVTFTVFTSVAKNRRWPSQQDRQKRFSSFQLSTQCFCPGKLRWCCGLFVRAVTLEPLIYLWRTKNAQKTPTTFLSR